MPDVVVAASAADAEAAEAIRHHHGAMAELLALHTEALVDAASRGDTRAAELARRELIDWCETELLPHARAEEEALYPEARGTVAGRPLIDGMVREHDAIGGLLGELKRSAGDPVRVAATARALQAMFETHLAKENDLVVPLLLSTPGVSLAGLLDGLHGIVGAEQPEHAREDGVSTGCGGHECSCGETDGPGFPELDARAVPHAIRHAAIFGALESVAPDGGLLLAAPHDPKRLLAQVDQRWPGRFAVRYVERGPQDWRLLFLRDAR